MHTPGARLRFAATAAGAPCLLLTACDGPVSTLAPAGPHAATIATLWWVMLASAAAIFAAVIGLVLLSFTRWRERAALPAGVWLIGGGLIFPSVTLLALLAYGVAAGESMLPRGREAVRVVAIARQWEWTFHYPALGGAETRGVLYLPAGRPVDVEVTSEDVIHSFWIPRLAGKLDAVPGHVAVLRVEAAQPGAFGARCAEFCGVGHATMTFRAEAVAPEAFESRVRAAASASP